MPRTADVMTTGIGAQERELEASPECARLARRFVAALLTDLGYPLMVEDAETIVSELVTNAMHATRAIKPNAKITVYLGTRYGKPVLEVWDCSRQLPEPRDEPHLGEDGRGLQIVRALAAAVGYEITPGGKVVWAILK